jgi:RHS repeat-associated protein
LLRFLTAFIREREGTNIPDTLQTYNTATASGVSQQSLEAVLAIRSSGQALYLEGFDPPNIPGDPGTDVWNGGDPFGSVLSELREAIQPEVSYYIQDHLGNTRVMYHTDLLSCQDYDVLYRLEHVLDYYPYGKTLRVYVPGPREKFQSTEHERDLETGLDHRGARMYDGDVGRFLGVDPLAADYAAWSPYNYVLGNPIKFIDPDGMKVDDHIIVNSSGIVTEIIPKEGPHKIFSETGSEIVPHDQSVDQEELSIYRVGDKIIEFISDEEFENIMTNAGAGKNDENIVSKSYSDYDFPYSTLNKPPYNNEIIIEERGRSDRAKFIRFGGFFVFSTENKHGDKRKAYNIHDAGNFLWGQATKRDGWSLKMAMFGADTNERLNLRFGDSIADQNAIAQGWLFK